MVTLRKRTKREESPEDVEPEPEPKPKQKRGSKAAVQPSSDDVTSQQPSNKVIKTEQSTFKNPKYESGETQLASGQYAKAQNLVIPVDELCPLNSFQVYIDDANIIWDANLNQTASGNNHNKFYRIQVLTDNEDTFYTWTRWGRVGERGQNAKLGDGSMETALLHFEKKFKDKAGLTWANRSDPPKSKKYVFLERSYEPDSSHDEMDEDYGEEGATDRSRSTSPAKCTLAPPIKSLVELIFNQQYLESTMADMNYDAKKMPLGKLSKPTITRGYQALKDLAALLDDNILDQSRIEELSDLFYSYIPHEFGRNRPPIINNQEQLKREVLLLESLTDLKDADAILKSDKKGSSVHPLDSRFSNLGLQETTPVDHQTPEFVNINEYLVKSNVHAINYELLDVFRIERQGEHKRFESAFGKVASDRRLLWHGSRVTNYGGILSQGLRIAPPEAPVSGYMFGKGVYLADASSKSANYCASYISGGHALLLLCEAELGKPMQTLTDASYSAGDDALAKGLHSTWGQGSTGPAGWKDAGCVHPSLAGVSMPDTTKEPGATNVAGAYLQFNEYICYDVSQIRLRYLLRVKM